MSTLLEDDAIVITEDDEAVPCYWQNPQCDIAAAWSVIWSCGCGVSYCEDHFECVINLKRVLCKLEHSPRPITIVACEKIRR